MLHSPVGFAYSHRRSWVQAAFPKAGTCWAYAGSQLGPSLRDDTPSGPEFLSQTHPSGCACPVLGLPWLLCAIKSYFKGQSLNFMFTLYAGSNLVG
jgi:hypothetical protein